jgi:uncharacterized membrane protein
MSLPPPHPVLVHFPLALIPLALLLDVLGCLLRREGLHRAAGINLVAGAAGAVAAAASGWFTGEHAEEVLEAAGTAAAPILEIVETHEILGISAAVLAVLLAAWRIGARLDLPERFREVHLGGLGLLLGILVVGSWLGGRLVYDHGIGTPAWAEASRSPEGAPPVRVTVTP